MRPSTFVILVALAGCGSSEPEPKPGPTPDLASFETKPECESRTFEGSSFTACRYDASKDRLELVDGQPLRSLEALEQWLGPRAADVRFAMNAGMYDEQGAPIGLFIADGETIKRINLRQGGGNFHLMPNGVFAVDGHGEVSVTASSDFEKKVRKPRMATQSGPMLVIDGKLHPKFDENGQSQLIRNGVGVSDNRTAWFVISEDPVSFGRFARFFRDALGCRNALYLDGSVSSLWDRGAGRQDAYSELGPMLVVFRRPPSSAR